MEYSSVCSVFLPMHGSRKLCTLLLSKHQHVWILTECTWCQIHRAYKARGERLLKTFSYFSILESVGSFHPMSISVKRISLCIGCNSALSESSLWTSVLARDQEGIYISVSKCDCESEIMRALIKNMNSYIPDQTYIIKIFRRGHKNLFIWNVF